MMPFQAAQVMKIPREQVGITASLRVHLALMGQDDDGGHEEVM